MRPLLLVLLAALSSSLALGCSSQLGLGRARTLDAGHTKIGAGFEADLLSANRGEKTVVPLPWTQVNVGVHHGVTDGVELGVRAWGFTVPNILTTWGVAADAKLALRRPDPTQSRLNIATGASFSYHQPRYGGNAYHLFSGTLPVLFGVSLGRHELVFGPRIADYVWTGYGQNTVNAFYFGSSLGFAAKVKQRFELFPEIVAMYSFTSFNGETTDEHERQGVLLFQGGIGGSFEL